MSSPSPPGPANSYPHEPPRQGIERTLTQAEVSRKHLPDRIPKRLLCRLDVPSIKKNGLDLLNRQRGLPVYLDL